MGDRTTVRLTVLSEQADVVERLVSDEAPDSQNEKTGEVTFHFYEVNYGSLSSLPKLLKTGIAYDFEWDAGSSYGAGSQTLRFTPEGECIEREVYDSGINPPLDDLLKAIDDHESLKKIIKDHEEKTVTPALDEKQIEYGKRYLAKQLIAPNSELN